VVGRAAERPPLTKVRGTPLFLGVAAATLGAAFEAGVSLSFGLTDVDAVVLAASLGILVAVLAGAAGGVWAGVFVAAVGWALHYTLVSEQTWRDLVAAPAWLAAAAAAGWVSRRLLAEAAARESTEERFAALRGKTRDAVVTLDGEGRVTGWSDGAERIFGYTVEDAHGVDFARIVGSGEDGEALGAVLEAAQRGDPRAEIELEHLRSDGSTRNVRLAARPVPEEAGWGQGTLVVGTDVTDLAVSRAARSELEARYQSLAQQLPGATYVHALGDRSKVSYVSPQVGTMLGYRAEDWLTDEGLFWRLVHEDDRPRVESELERATQAKSPFVSEYRMLNRNGTIVWVRDEASTLRGTTGEARYVQGYLHDITAEQEARLERERLRTSEKAAVAEAVDRQLKLDLIARATVALSGTFEKDVALRRAAELFTEGFAGWCVIDLVEEKGGIVRSLAVRGDVDPVVGAPSAEAAPAAIEVIETGDAIASESRLCVPIGARGRILGAITLMADPNGRTYGPDDLTLAEHLALLAGLVIDNSRLHQQVQEGADAAHVLTYVADGVFLVDRSGVVRLWNPTMEAITGFDAQRVVGSLAVDAIPDWTTLSDRIPIGGAEPVSPETLPFETAFGERWVSISGVEFFDGTVYALRDLTETRRLEQLKADFVATASHELRTPLAAVYGAAQTLRRHDFALDESGRERFVSLIVEEAERLGRIVNDILLANQLDVGTLELRNEVFDPTDLVERVVEAARAHAPASITIEIEAPGPIRPVASDRDRVRQVLVNLVENAIKYSPEGGRIDVGVAPNDRMVRFYVRDEGLGIPEDERDRIFEKFYRLDPNMTAGVGGTGLGLYICNELVRRLGGRIWVESNEGRGSTFSFVVPAADKPAVRPSLQEVFGNSGA
jgi:PAS domain S-box-containing protein